MKLWYSSPVIKYWLFNNIKLWDTKHCVTHMGHYPLLNPLTQIRHILIWTTWLHSRDTLCCCSVGLQLPQVHGSISLVAMFMDIVWSGNQNNKANVPLVLYFFNLVNILVGVSQLVWITFCTPLMLFFLNQPLCKKGLTDRDSDKHY